MRQARQAGDAEFIALYAPKPVNLPEAIEIYKTAYLMLDAEREFTSRIPWSKIVTFCTFYRMSDDQTDWMIDIIWAVDNKIVEDRIKKERNGRPENASGQNEPDSRKP